jgi:menaquinone-dependent protoporphyrinogen IX oxidase
MQCLLTKEVRKSAVECLHPLPDDKKFEIVMELSKHGVNPRVDDEYLNEMTSKIAQYDTQVIGVSISPEHIRTQLEQEVQKIVTNKRKDSELSSKSPMSRSSRIDSTSSQETESDLDKDWVFINST